jgi:hypothetical protein
MAPNPSAPVPNAPKKGMSGLAIAGFGCLGLFALVAIASVVLLMKGCAMVKDVANDFQKNPEKATALLILKANPDIDVVKSDDTAGEITIRDKKTHEETTITYSDIKQGKFKLKNSKGEEVTVDPANKDGNGSVVVKNKEGTTVLGGDQAATAPPAWVPVYPNVKVKTGGMRSESGSKVNGLFMSETSDPPAKVKEFFDGKLKELGYEVSTSSYTTDKGEVSSLSSTKDAEQKKISVVVSIEDGKTALMVQYEGPKN